LSCKLISGGIKESRVRKIPFTKGKGGKEGRGKGENVSNFASDQSPCRLGEGEEKMRGLDNLVPTR